MYALASEHAAHAVPVGEPGIVDTLLWGVLPYVTILVLIGGTIWRYRTDQFSWTTRSSQIYESKMLRLGSPLFHYGLAAVFIGTAYQSDNVISVVVHHEICEHLRHH